MSRKLRIALAISLAINLVWVPFLFSQDLRGAYVNAIAEITR